jgi:hypothetical protein
MRTPNSSTRAPSGGSPDPLHAGPHLVEGITSPPTAAPASPEGEEKQGDPRENIDPCSHQRFDGDGASGSRRKKRVRAGRLDGPNSSRTVAAGLLA